MNHGKTSMFPGLTLYSGTGELTWVRAFRDLDFQSDLDDSLMALYKRLLFAKRSNLMRVDDLDFQEIVGPELLGTSHRLRVDDGNPDNFTFEIFGDEISLAGGINYLGKSLSLVPMPAFRRSLQEAYQFVITSQRPLFSVIRTQQNALFSEYRRLVIPLTNKQGIVTELLVSSIITMAPLVDMTGIVSAGR